MHTITLPTHKSRHKTVPLPPNLSHAAPRQSAPPLNPTQPLGVKESYTTYPFESDSDFLHLA